METEHRDRDSELRVEMEETQGIEMVFVNAKISKEKVYQKAEISEIEQRCLRDVKEKGVVGCP